MSYSVFNYCNRPVSYYSPMLSSYVTSSCVCRSDFEVCLQCVGRKYTSLVAETTESKPKVDRDFVQDEKSCSFKVVLPGFLKEEIAVSVDGKIISVTAEQKEVGDRLKVEKVEHTFSLPCSICDVEARLELGILYIMCKKVNTKVSVPVN